MTKNDILGILMPERTKQIALAWSILRESHLGEDAYQDMLAKVFENEMIFEGPEHLRAWSWNVLRNRCYEVIRKRKSHATLLDESTLDLVDAELETRESDPISEQADALHYLGVLSHQNGRTAEAIDFIRRALEIAPDYIDAHNNLGNVLKEAGQLAEAETHLRRVVALNPEHAEARRRMEELTDF